MVSPYWTTTAPWACLAIFPVSRMRVWAPKRRSTRLTCTDNPPGQAFFACRQTRSRTAVRTVRGFPGREGKGPGKGAGELLAQTETTDDFEIPTPILVPK